MRLFIVGEPVKSVNVCPIRQQSTRKIVLVDMLLRIERFGAEKNVIV
jgi:hypothetical protein